LRIELPTDIFTYPDIALPQVWTVEQPIDTRSMQPADIERAVGWAVSDLVERWGRKPGGSVAIGVGSRGLDNLQLIVRTSVELLRAAGFKPFIVPAMGSHGGATAEGQAKLLRTYGIEETTVGAEVRATMDVVEIGTLEGPDAGEFAGHKLVVDRNAYGADAILVINRIKPHTCFTGPIESGVAKMLAIGLGKRQGAEAIHRHGSYGLRELIPRVARAVASRLPVLGGIALLDNALGKTAEIHALAPAEIGQQRETDLLARAAAMTPSLPFESMDVLVIDEMGKNISGTGMDTHVIGRMNMPSIPVADWPGPDVRVVVVLDLTPETHGNATSIGLADITTRRLIENTDWAATLTNMRTSGEGGVRKCQIPLVLETPEDCVRTAMGTCGQYPMERVRLARIRNTLDMRRIEVTEALAQEARQNPSLTVYASSRQLDLSRPVGAAAVA
jgi:hypothetical protein